MPTPMVFYERERRIARVTRVNEAERERDRSVPLGGP